jgi:hypothetical protein
MGMKELNLHRLVWNQSCYRYTNPLYKVTVPAIPILQAGPLGLGQPYHCPSYGKPPSMQFIDRSYYTKQF